MVTLHHERCRAFAAMGMVPPGPGLRLYKPITGTSARLSGTAVTITLQVPAPSDAYQCALTQGDAQFSREIADQGGIMLAVTYAVDPSFDDLARQFRDALRGGRLLCGWVALENGRQRPH